MAQSGALVLFHGTTPRSWFCEWFGWSPWSHIGIVLPPTLGSVEPRFLESVGHADALRCTLCGRSGAGPRVVTLRNRLEQYCAETKTGSIHMCIIPLEAWSSADNAFAPITVADPDRLDKICAALTRYASQACACAYQSNPIVLATAVMHAPQLRTLSGVVGLQLPLQDDCAAPLPHSMQCAELVANALSAAGILRHDFEWRDVLPSAFVTGQIRDRDYASPTTLAYSHSQYVFDTIDQRRVAAAPQQNHLLLSV